MAVATLQEIRKKVRRITRNPNTSQLSNEDLDQYINTAIQYDFPENLRLFSLRTTLTFYTQPNVDSYDTNITNPLDPLYNFKNKYTAIHTPAYIAGIPAFYTQWRDVFYANYPQTNTIADTQLNGDGTTGPFVGTVTGRPMLQNNVVFTCLDTNGTAMILVDYPLTNSTGALGLPNEPQTSTATYGSIDYISGAFSATFASATQVGAPIYSENIVYQAGKPYSILFYDEIFTIRPVPDKAYTVQLEVDVRPTELIETTDVPDLEQWWQYIAYLAAKKIFEDRMESDSIDRIRPELEHQEMLVQRKAIEQQAVERTVTIYTLGKNYGYRWFGPRWPY